MQKNKQTTKLIVCLIDTLNLTVDLSEAYRRYETAVYEKWDDQQTLTASKI